MTVIKLRRFNLGKFPATIVLPKGWINYLKSVHGDDTILELKLTVTDKVVIEVVNGASKKDKKRKRRRRN